MGPEKLAPRMSGNVAEPIMLPRGVASQSAEPPRIVTLSRWQEKRTMPSQKFKSEIPVIYLAAA